MDSVSEFMSRYRREFDFYELTARLAAQRLEALVQAAGIRAIVTGRAKNPSRLEAKARQRNKSRVYETVDEVYKDIVDLAGARLALYFPADRLEIDKLIRANFDVTEPSKEFPEASSPTYKKRFSGYWATHYRVRLREADLSEAQKRYAEARIEIQVASVLMHAWSEVEHDLVYKPFEGRLSEDEYAILDELNGLVIAGEIALERLQRAIEARVAQKDRHFGNHFDLAGYLFEAARPVLLASPDETALGRVDLLFALLERLNLDTPGKLAQYIKNLHSDTDRRPIAEQIIDAILGADAQRYEQYSEVRASIEPQDGGVGARAQSPEQQAALGRFLHSWIQFEKAVRGRIEPKSEARNAPFGRLISKLDIDDAAVRFDIDRIRSLRNKLVHGIEVPDSFTLSTSSERLDQITAMLKKRGRGGRPT
jgi:ppGpp synthetase/RelA/SpoT-type nucleotidyltranferase